MKQKTIPKKVGEKLGQAILDSRWKNKTAFTTALVEAFPYDFEKLDVRTVRKWCNEGIDSIAKIFTIAQFLDIPVSALLPQ